MGAPQIITGEVPFSQCIYCHCRIQNFKLEKLAKLSHRLESSYLAWESVRKGRNPYFIEGTGFEGYLVGWCSTPEEALYVLIDIGREILHDIDVRYHLEHVFKSRLMQTLTGERQDSRAVQAWQNELGVMLARLRCHVWEHETATEFRSETYRQVKLLPAIRYHTHEHHIDQSYQIAPLPVSINGFQHRVHVNPLLRECMAHTA